MKRRCTQFKKPYVQLVALFLTVFNSLVLLIVSVSKPQNLPLFTVSLNPKNGTDAENGTDAAVILVGGWGVCVNGSTTASHYACARRDYSGDATGLPAAAQGVVGQLIQTHNSWILIPYILPFGYVLWIAVVSVLWIRRLLHRRQKNGSRSRPCLTTIATNIILMFSTVWLTLVTCVCMAFTLMSLDDVRSVTGVSVSTGIGLRLVYTGFTFALLACLCAGFVLVCYDFGRSPQEDDAGGFVIALGGRYASEKSRTGSVVGDLGSSDEGERGLPSLPPSAKAGANAAVAREAFLNSPSSFVQPRKAPQPPPKNPNSILERPRPLPTRTRKAAPLGPTFDPTPRNDSIRATTVDACRSSGVARSTLTQEPSFWPPPPSPMSVNAVKSPNTLESMTPLKSAAPSDIYGQPTPLPPVTPKPPPSRRGVEDSEEDEETAEDYGQRTPPPVPDVRHFKLEPIRFSSFADRLLNRSRSASSRHAKPPLPGA